MKRKYSWARENQYPVSAQIIGKWTESLPDSQPATVIEAARNPRSPAHKIFEWNEGAAAQKYRLVQARELFGSLIVDVVIYKREKPVTHRVRAIMRTSRSGEYATADEALSKTDSRNFILAQALSQLNAIKRRYATLAELSEVFAAVEQVQKRQRKKAA